VVVDLDDFKGINERIGHAWQRLANLEARHLGADWFE
jgi:GGDEF domain-containing protein